MTSPIESPNPSSIPIARQEPSFLVRVFASGLFAGYSPIASGTVGSAVALGLYLIPGFERPWIIMPVCFLVFLFGAKAAEIMEGRYGHDPGEVTIDEVLGMWISLLLLPKSLGVAVLGFLIFRILDIVKPYPARKFDSMKGGVGIMLDDVIAGAYTNIILSALLMNPYLRSLLLGFSIPL
jgi:phosphatidylglycerophosphatase A